MSNSLPEIHPEVASAAAALVNNLAYQANATAGHHETAMSALRASALPAMVMAVADDGPPTIPQTKDKFDQLADMLLAAPTPPADQVKSGKAPSATNVYIQPQGNLKTERLAMYQALTNMSSIAQLYTGILDVQARTKRNHPDQYKITDPVEALQAYADQADFAYAAMTGPLAGFYIFTGGSMQSYKQQMTRAEFHAGFLGEIFKGFQLSDGALTSLDTILTNFATSVSNISIEDASNSKTVNFTLKVNTVPEVNISGDDKNPDYAYTPQTQLIYMKLEASAWKTVMSKWQGGGSVEHFEFAMFWSSTTCQLNTDMYNASKDKFDKIFQFVTSKNLAAFGADEAKVNTVVDKNMGTSG